MTETTPTLSIDLSGKVALVTGASRGIGRSVAVELGRNGALVGCVARNAEKLAETVKLISDAGGQAEAFGCDVTDGTSVEAVVESVCEKWGTLDILVNNAGIRIPKPALEVTEEDWDATIDINLKGVFFCAQAAGRHMVAQGYGRIINLGSQLSVTASRGRSSYCASKFGVAGITKVMAVEWAIHGVTVNAIGPGPTSTPGMLAADSRSPEEVQEDLEAHLPLGRRMDPEEMVGAVIYLASKSSAGTTGHLLLVDGGWTAI